MSPKGLLVAQLSHLPIGPSHVLICLLVNPPFPLLLLPPLRFRRPPTSPSLVVYFALDFPGTLSLVPLISALLFALLRRPSF